VCEKFQKGVVGMEVQAVFSHGRNTDWEQTERISREGREGREGRDGRWKTFVLEWLR
jgi:hypothetical protein